MRQQLRGLALTHDELILAALSKTVISGPVGARRGDSAAFSTRVRDEGERGRREDHGQGHGDMQGARWVQQGVPELAGGRLGMACMISRWRYEARPQPAGDFRWALAIDEGGMERVSSLALEASLVDGTGLRAEDVKLLREAFRRMVGTMGGCRFPTELCGGAR